MNNYLRNRGFSPANFVEYGEAKAPRPIVVSHPRSMEIRIKS